jgi:20S proteasome alpha/beta subunit
MSSKSMTLIVAYKTKEGNVILASDTLAVREDSTKVESSKIMKVEDILIAQSGFSSCCQNIDIEIKKALEKFKKEKEIGRKRALIREAVDEARYSYKKSCKDKTRKWEVKSLLVFHHNDEVKILEICEDGSDTEVEENFVAIGSGAKPAKAVYHNLHLDEPTNLQDALPAIYSLFNSVEKTLITVEGFDVWIYMKNKKIKHLSKKEIEEIKKESINLDNKISKIVHKENRKINLNIREENKNVVI